MLVQACNSFIVFVSYLAMAHTRHDRSRTPPSLTPRQHIFDSKLALVLVRDWSWGHKSAVQLRNEAHAAYQDQVDLLTRLGISTDHASQSLASISALGTYGEYESNISKQLKTMLGDPTFPEPHCEAVPMRILKPKGEHIDEEIRPVDFPIIPPHLYLAWLWKSKPDIFAQQFLGGDATGNSLVDFWNEVISRDDPRLEGLDFSDRPNWKSKAIPIMLHGDQVPCIAVGKPGSKSYDTCSMQGVLSSGSTLQQKIYLYGLFPDNQADDMDGGTMETIWGYLGFSLWFAFLGIWPTVDHISKNAFHKASSAFKLAG